MCIRDSAAEAEPSESQDSSTEAAPTGSPSSTQETDPAGGASEGAAGGTGSDSETQVRTESTSEETFSMRGEVTTEGDSLTVTWD